MRVGKLSNIQGESLSISASVGSNALTLGLNPCVLDFRDATLVTGVPNRRSIPTALSLVVPSGATLGFEAVEAGRAYIWVIDNAGTTELAISRTSDIFPESNLVSTTAIGTGSDSASVMYSTSARTNVACRCIGYIEITTGATAGEWDNAPTKIQAMGPGARRSGDMVQRVRYQTGAKAIGSTASVFDDSIPQITEGDEYMTVSITPTSVLNNLYIDIVTNTDIQANSYALIALHQDAVANALASVLSYNPTNEVRVVSFSHKMIAGTVSPTTFRVRIGSTNGSSVTFNGMNNTAYLGGVCASSITVTEVFA